MIPARWTLIALIVGAATILSACGGTTAPTSAAAQLPHPTRPLTTLADIPTYVPSDFDVNVPVWTPGDIGVVQISHDPPPTHCTVHFHVHDVAFKVGSAVITDSAAHDIVAFVTMTTQGNPGRVFARVDIGGYASVEGSDASNQMLSQHRADAVKALLRTIPDLAKLLMYSVGFGETEQFARGTDEAALSQNRRVTVLLHFRGCNRPAAPTGGSRR